MRKLMMAAALAVATMGGAAAFVANRAEAQVGTALAGDWQGGYISSDGADVNTFNVKLAQAGGAISGTIYEVNAFGDASRALFLTSTFNGTASGRQVRFTKTYDGSGGASHSVSYSGTLDGNNRRVTGTYNADGATGRFEMVRN